jgi:hypothetical protein
MRQLFYVFGWLTAGAGLWLIWFALGLLRRWWTGP